MVESLPLGQFSPVRRTNNSRAEPALPPPERRGIRPPGPLSGAVLSGPGFPLNPADRIRCRYSNPRGCAAEGTGQYPAEMHTTGNGIVHPDKIFHPKHPRQLPQRPYSRAPAHRCKAVGREITGGRQTVPTASGSSSAVVGFPGSRCRPPGSPAPAAWRLLGPQPGPPVHRSTVARQPTATPPRCWSRPHRRPWVFPAFAPFWRATALPANREGGPAPSVPYCLRYYPAQSRQDPIRR